MGSVAPSRSRRPDDQDSGFPVEWQTRSLRSAADLEFLPPLLLLPQEVSMQWHWFRFHKPRSVLWNRPGSVSYGEGCPYSRRFGSDPETLELYRGFSLGDRG